MTEILLNAILNLFSIQAAMLPKEQGRQARDILHSYLTTHLGIGQPETYLELFDIALSLHDDTPVQELTAQAADVTRHLKPELPRLEQYVFLLRYLELTAKTGAAHTEEANLSTTVAREFDIPAEEAELLGNLCLNAPLPAAPPASLLRFDAAATDNPLARPDFKGSFSIVRLADVDGYVVFGSSSAPVTLDSIPLAPGSPRLLPSGAILRDAFGARIYYNEISAAYTSSTSSAPPLVFEGRDLEFRYPGSDNGLHSFNFCQKGGGLVGVMGVSGAGKSTLLGLLNGQMKPDSGQVLINGTNLHTNAHDVEGVIGYVPQDDLLFEDLTVFDNLYYSASLCMANLTADERRASVDHLLAELQQPGIRDLKVGSPLDKTISGGQRKRLNIALELIREPSILFVDEPTSGLSSSDSENVMSLLKAQAAKGRLVIVVIHQPSSRIFKMLDTLWILDQGGHPIYDGNPLDAIVHFRSAVHQAGMEEYACPQCGSVNPEQVFEIIEARKVDDQGNYTRERSISPKQWHQSYLDLRASTPAPLPANGGDQETPDVQDDLMPERRLWRPSTFGQLGLFFMRQLKGRLANRQYLTINLLEPPLLALLAALISHGSWGRDYVFMDNQNIGTYLFIAVIVALFLGMSVSAEEINRDRKILRREEFLHLSRPAYLASKTLYLTIVAALQMGLFVLVGNWLLEVPDMTGPTWLVLFSCAMVSSILGLNISDSFRSAVTIYILIPLLLVPQMMLGGAVVPLDELLHVDAGNRNTPLVADIMPSRWGYEALIVRQYTQNDYMLPFLEDDCARKQAQFQVDYHLPAVRALADFPLLPKPDTMTQEDWTQQAENTLATLKNELLDFSELTEIPLELDLSALTVEHYDAPTMQRAKTFLKQVSAVYKKQRKESEAAHRATQEQRIANLGRDGLDQLKAANFNRDISNLVLNRTSFEAVRHSGQHLVQIAMPICIDPETDIPAARQGEGSPLFVSKKRLGSALLDTFSYNLLVLWGMVALLYATLHLRLLPRLLSLGKNPS